MLTTGVPGPNKIQGIGPNFVPGILDRKAFDAVEDVEYDAAIAMQRRFTREEGLLSGISTGAIVAAAAKVSAVLGPGKTVVCILLTFRDLHFLLLSLYILIYSSDSLRADPLGCLKQACLFLSSFWGQGYPSFFIAKFTSSSAAAT
jgi:hypothetical protein